MDLHKVIPKNVANRLIHLDVDVKLEGNILELYDEFDQFTKDQIIGLAFEQQPVYR